jgi:hypothetical protein
MSKSDLLVRLLSGCGVLFLMLAVALSPVRPASAEEEVYTSPVCDSQCQASGTLPNCSCSGSCNKVNPDPFPGQVYECRGCTAGRKVVAGVPSCGCGCVDHFS